MPDHDSCVLHRQLTTAGLEDRCHHGAAIKRHIPLNAWASSGMAPTKCLSRKHQNPTVQLNTRTGFAEGEKAMPQIVAGM
jgi:hypothetical protein